MAKIPSLRSLSNSDFNGKAPDWFIDFLQMFNQFTNDVETALDNGITFAENVAMSTIPVTFTGGNALTFKSKLRGKAQGVLLVNLKTNPQGVGVGVTWTWNEAQTGVISINITAGIVTGTNYAATFLVF